MPQCPYTEVNSPENTPKKGLEKFPPFISMYRCSHTQLHNDPNTEGRKRPEKPFQKSWKFPPSLHAIPIYP